LVYAAPRTSSGVITAGRPFARATFAQRAIVASRGLAGSGCARISRFEPFRLSDRTALFLAIAPSCHKPIDSFLLERVEELHGIFILDFRGPRLAPAKVAEAVITSLGSVFFDGMAAFIARCFQVRHFHPPLAESTRSQVFSRSRSIIVVSIFCPSGPRLLTGKEASPRFCAKQRIAVRAPSSSAVSRSS
jgi:hypothetical protein